MLRNLNQKTASGQVVLGIPYVGMLASELPTGFPLAGSLNNDVEAGDPVGTRYCGTMTAWPSQGTMTVYEDGSLSFVGAPDGVYNATMQVKKYSPAAGLFLSEPAPIVMTVGAAAGSAPGATLTSVSVLTRGAASASSSAPGATLASSPVFTAGGATGGAAPVNANAPGATLVSAGAFSPGAASSGSIPNSVVVPASRTAVFAGGSRVVLFGTESSPKLLPNGPYLKNKKWTINKVPADKLYYIGDVTRDLADSGTTIKSVTALTNGVTLLEGPSPQGGLIVVKIGGLNLTTGFDNYCTLRILLNNGEQIDRTIHFALADDRSWSFAKDPDDQRFYAIDVSSDLEYSSTTLASVQAPTPVGVTSLAAPITQGGSGIVKLGSLDIAGANTCTLPLTFATGEQVFRTIYFTATDN
jgi:hypothetical protein